MSQATALESEFQATYGTPGERPEWGPGWRITHMPTFSVIACSRSKDLKFGREIDCRIAVESFTRLGITTEAAMRKLKPAERVRIALENLQW